jgi:enolase
MEIKKIKASEILDSRGNPTVMCEVFGTAAKGIAMVPSGASTGEWEAVELRDGDKSRYNGKGVLKAVSNVNRIIAPELVGKMSACNQIKLDRFLCELDGTPNKGKLGANAILSVSVGVMYLAAACKKQEPHQYIADIYKKLKGETTGKKLPIPSFNIINGGAHADSGIDIQEFMVQPIGGKTFAEKLRMGAEITAALKRILTETGLVTAVGDEGGFAPRIEGNSRVERALDLIMEAIGKAGYKAGVDAVIALDAAASEFYDPQKKVYELKHDDKIFNTNQIIDFYETLVKKYPIKSIEDPLDQNDWKGYVDITKRLGNKITIVGDDFFVTNKKRLARGIKMGTCNAILIKLNQIGTLTETLETIALAKANDYKVMISHRSGETSDTVIADLSVAVDAEFIKSGAPVRGERVCKYNRLLAIEHGE